MAVISKLVAELSLDDKDFTSGVSRAQGSAKLLGTAVKAALLGTVAGAALATVGLFKIGSAWDSATDTIIAKTGASGDELKAFQDITKDVFTSIPTDMETAANAVADLSQKTGDTGDTLDALAKSEIELSRITGTDLAGNIDASAKLFNVFGVAAEDQVSTLDDLFTVSQKTGVGIDQLMSETQRFAPVLKQMGLSASAGANLIGKMDKAGLNTARDMKGLNTAIVGMAKSGVSAKTGLTDAYNGIKNAGSASEATAMAVKIFGKAAGPELAQAIREGKISLDDLIGSVDLSGDSILDTAAKTNDFSENFKIFKNNIEAALIPLGNFVFNGLNKLIPLLTDGVQALGTFGSAMKRAFDTGQQTSTILKGFPDVLKPIIGPLLDIADAAGDVVRAFNKDGLSGAFDALGPAIKQAIGAIADIVIDVPIKVGKWLIGKIPDLWEWLKGVLGVGTSATGDGTGGPDSDKSVTLADVAVSVLDWVIASAADIGTAIVKFLGKAAVKLESVAVSISGWVLSTVQDIAPQIQSWLNGHTSAVTVPVNATIKFASINLPNLGSAILSAIVNLDTRGWGEAIGEKFRSLDWSAAASNFWTGLKSALDTNVAIVLIFFTSLPLLLVSAIVGAGALMTLKALEFLQGFFDGLTNGWTGSIVPWLQTIPTMATDAIGDLIATLLQKGIDLIQGLSDGAAQLWETVNAWLGSRSDAAISGIGDLTATLLQAGIDLIQGLSDGAAQLWDTFNGWLGSRSDAAVSGVGDLGSTLSDAGGSLIDGMYAAAQDQWDTMASWLSGLGSLAADAVGNTAGALYDAGYALVQGMANGVSAGAGLVGAAVDAIVGSIPAAVRALLGINSPSKVMSDLLYGVPEGMAKGMLAGQPLVNRAALSLGSGIPGTYSATATVNAGYMGAGSAGYSSSGGTSHSWGGITINVTGGGDPRATAEEVFTVFSREMRLRGGM